MADVEAAIPASAVRARVHEWLSPRVSSRAVRAFAAFASALVTALATGGGMLAVPRGPQAALLAAAAGGAVAQGPLDAAAVTFAASLAAAWIGPRISQTPVDPPQAVAIAILAAVLGAGIAMASNRRGARRIVTWAAVLLVVGNVWVTSLNVAANVSIATGSQTVPPLREVLKGNVPQWARSSDEYFFLNVLDSVRRGGSYYPAYVADYTRLHPSDPPLHLPTDIREPLSFRLWALLPAGGLAMPVAYLALVTLALLCVPPLLARVIRAPFAIPAVCLAAANLMQAAVSVSILRQTAWIGALAIPMVALVSASRGRIGREAAAAGIAVFAALLREIVVPFMLAGVAATALVRDARTKARSLVWGGAIAVFGAAYAVHWSMASAVLPADRGSGTYASGGLGFLLAGLSGSDLFFGGKGRLIAALAVVGLVGVAAIPDLRARTFALAAVGLPLVAFLVVSDHAFAPGTGAPINYWGEMITPLLLVFAPAALSWLPGLSPPVEAAAFIEGEPVEG